MTAQFLLDCIKSILITNRHNLQLPISQRARFEGWLKIELAHLLSFYMNKIAIEQYFKPYHIDIQADNSLIELKTANTTYSTRTNCPIKCRPISQNIKSIIGDINKLRTILSRNPNIANIGFIAFVLFPINTNLKYRYHIQKIDKQIGNNQHAYATIRVCNLEIFIYVAEV